VFQAQAWIRGEDGKFHPEVPEIPPKPPPAKKVEETFEPMMPASLRAQFATPLARAATVWGGIFVTVYPLLELATSTHQPVLIAHTMGAIAASIFWWDDADHFKQAIYKVKNLTEEITGWDIDRDSHIGVPPPEVINPIPVHNWQGSDTIGVPDPQPQRERVIRLRPSTRTISPDKLCNYLLWAFDNTADGVDGWTRDRAAEYGINQKEWADIKAFVERWDAPDAPLWKTTNRPTLDRFVSSLLTR